MPPAISSPSPTRPLPSSYEVCCASTASYLASSDSGISYAFADSPFFGRVVTNGITLFSLVKFAVNVHRVKSEMNFFCEALCLDLALRSSRPDRPQPIERELPMRECNLTVTGNPASSTDSGNTKRRATRSSRCRCRYRPAHLLCRGRRLCRVPYHQRSCLSLRRRKPWWLLRPHISPDRHQECHRPSLVRPFRA